ncbi:MAG: V-type ATP synthase subunit A, partial [Porphyromonadaceae bacterium]|nr:V-type ATP synthase subunit A [Porphyromonadaceae bacterium]
MTTKGIVKGIVSNLVTIEVDGPVAQNEICYITVAGTPLMSEVIKVIGKNAYAQVFESTRGMRI